MEKDIEKIFNRQFERCKNDLLQVNCPRIFIDCFSKYFDFAKLDIIDRIKESSNDGNSK